MAFEHEPGKISIFKNDKSGNEKAPEYRGRGKLELPDGGTMKVEVALWVNQDKNGNKYFGGSIKEDTYAPKDVPLRSVKEDNPFDDAIPF